MHVVNASLESMEKDMLIEIHAQTVYRGRILAVQEPYQAPRVSSAMQVKRPVHLVQLPTVHVTNALPASILVPAVPRARIVKLASSQAVQVKHPAPRVRRASPASILEPAVPRARNVGLASSQPIRVKHLAPRVRRVSPASIPVLAVLHARIAPRARTRTQMAQPPTPFARIVPRGNSLTPLVHL